MKAYTLSEEIKEDKLFHLYLNNQYQRSLAFSQNKMLMFKFIITSFLMMEG